MAALVPAALSELLGIPATVVFLSLGAFDLPVVQVAGIVRVVNSQAVVVEMHSALPGGVDPRVRFGVYAEGRHGLVSFQTGLAEPYVAGTHLLMLRTPRQVETVQRRHFSRVKLSARVRFRDERDSGEATVQNLSAGGALLLSSTAMRIGTQYELELQPEDEEAIRGLTARVVRCTPGSQGQWQVGVEFVKPPVSLEMALVKLVWREQIRQRRPHPTND